MPCEAEAIRNPAASTSAPPETVQRAPIQRIAIAGSGLLRPQASPSREKLSPASVSDQCRSAHMVNSTTASEVKVVPVTKKNASDDAARTTHLPSMQSSFRR